MAHVLTVGEVKARLAEHPDDLPVYVLLGENDDYGGVVEVDTDEIDGEPVVTLLAAD